MKHTHCKLESCGIPLVSTWSWSYLPVEKRVGKSPHHGRGLCRVHYEKLRRHGDPEYVPSGKRAKCLNRRPQLRREDVLEEWSHLSSDCDSLEEAAERIGMTLKGLEEALRRARRAGHDEAQIPRRMRRKR